MKKTYKKLWALLMSFMLVFTMMPAMAFASDGGTTYPIFTPDKRTKKPHNFAYFTSVHVTDTEGNVASVDATDPYNATVYLNQVPKTEEDVPKAEYTADGAKVSSLVITNTVTVDNGEAVQTIHAYYNDRNQTTWTITYKGMCNDQTADHTWSEGVVQKEPTCIPGEEVIRCSKCGQSTIKPLAPIKDHEWGEGVIVKQSYWDENAGETLFTCKNCPTTRTESAPLIENPEFITGAYYLDSEGSKVELTFEKRDSSVKIYEWVKFYNPIFTFNVPEGIETIYVECTTDVWQVASHYWKVAINENNTPSDAIDETGTNQGQWTVENGVIAMPVESFVGGAFAAAVDGDSHCRICYVGVDVFHTYDQEVVNEFYLASEADFNNAATYYKSCVCGDMGEETFSYGVSLGAPIKDEVKEKIANYKNAAYYRDAQKAELATAIEEAKAAIDRATSEEAVEKAFADAKTAMDQIKTDAQLKAEEEAVAAAALAKAKADAKEALANYKNAADYRDAQKAELTEAITAANTAIESAKTPAEVEAAVKTAQAAMDQIKTDAQLKAEEEANKPADKEPVVEKQQLKAPSKVSASNVASTGKVKLTWSKVEGASEYLVYRATSKDGTYKKMFTTTGTQYTNTSAKAGTSYYYKVKAVSFDKDVEDSAYSKIVKRTCDLARPVVKASNIAKTGKVKLTWSKVEGASEYLVYRATSKDGTYKKMFTTTGTQYTNTSAKAGTAYYYKVKAIDADNSAANSAFSTVDKRTCDLARPEVTVKSTVKKQVKLTWKKVDGAKKYVVYRATSKNGKYSKIATTTKLSYTNKSLKSGKTYYYKVKAIAKSSAANSAFSTVDKCKVK